MNTQQEKLHGGEPSPDHPVVSPEAWLEARRALLEEEKELTRLKDRLSIKRRELPWTRVAKEYVFDGSSGRETLAQLFDGRSQLIVQHFMFPPDWEEGCEGCSFTADHVDGANLHLPHHDVTLVVVSRAPLAKLEAFRKRMGWKFKWVSSHGSDFNYDFHVSFTPESIARGTALDNYRPAGDDAGETGGHSVFYKDGSGTVYHTYSTFARGDEQMIGTYNYLDITPKGRNETGPHFHLGDWVRLHDRYEDAPKSGCGCH